jgi:DNA-binding CsgD family transcriptional regulator
MMANAVTDLSRFEAALDVLTLVEQTALKPRERRVIELRLQGATFDELGLDLKVSRERARQLLRHSILKLHAQIKDRVAAEDRARKLHDEREAQRARETAETAKRAADWNAGREERALMRAKEDAAALAYERDRRIELLTQRQADLAMARYYTEQWTNEFRFAFNRLIKCGY